MEARTAEAARKIIAEVQWAQSYGKLSKAAKGTVRRYLMRVTGYGRAQITRLIGEYAESGELKQARGGFQSATRRPISNCWPPWTRLIRDCRAQLCAGFETRVGDIWRHDLRAPGQHFGLSYLQSAEHRYLPQAPDRVQAYTEHARRSENVAVRTRKAHRDGFAWTRCIRAIRATENPVCTTSMPSIP
jgi:hypothetical protein